MKIYGSLSQTHPTNMRVTTNKFKLVFRQSNLDRSFNVPEL